MTDLTDTQTLILSTACARENGLIFPVTANLKGGAVGNICKSLLKRGLIEEIPAADPDTVWRHGEAGSLTLRATPLAHQTLGIGDAPETPEPTPVPKHQRSGTKQEAVIALLKSEGGATIAEIMAATSWASHTARGFLSGALKKKLGLTITSDKVDSRGRVYRTSNA